MPRQTLAKRPAAKKRAIPKPSVSAPMAADMAPVETLAPPAPITPAGPYILPMAQCPEEMKWLAYGHTVGLVVMGRLTPEGVAIEAVLMKR